MIKSVISFVLLFSIVSAANYKYIEIKDGNRYTYKKELSKIYIRNSQDKINYSCICEAFISFDSENNKDPLSFRLQYYCHAGNDLSSSSGYCNINDTPREIVNTYDDLIKHFKLEKQIKQIKNIRVTTISNDIRSPFLIKALNKEEAWSKKVYKTSSYKAYRNNLRILIQKTQVYKPIIELFKKYNCDISIEKYFSEKMWYKGKAQLVSKQRISKNNLMTKEEIRKEMYPSVQWIDFDINCSTKPPSNTAPFASESASAIKQPLYLFNVITIEPL